VNWYDLVGMTSSYTSTTFIVTTDVVPGTTYKFKVSAKNAHGFGLASTEADIEASDKPV
jgi:hypothetical protein